MLTLNRRIFLGTTADLYRLGSSGSDDGVAIAARWQSVRFGPSGQGGEAIFTALHPVIAYSGGVTLRFTPIIDDVVYDGTDGANAAVEVTLTAPTDGRLALYQEELGLSIPNIQGGVDQGRFALRGRWCQIRVEPTTVIGDDADGNRGLVRLQGMEIEYQPVTRSRPAVAAPSYP